MYGDYLNVDFYTHYYHNAKEILKVISPDHYDRFADSLTERLIQLQDEEVIIFWNLKLNELIRHAKDLFHRFWMKIVKEIRL